MRSYESHNTNMDSFESQSQSDPNLNRFDELPIDLKLDIIGRLDPSTAAKATTISKTWLSLVTQCIPKKSSSFTSTLFMVGPQLCSAHFARNKYDPIPIPITDSESVAKRFRSLEIPIHTDSLSDFSNGMVLSCQRTETDGPYGYFAANYFTGQCVRVAKPTSSEAAHGDAVLVYEPSRSSFFWIVEFEVDYILNVYSSETRDWKTTCYSLDTVIVGAEWSKQSLVLGGSVYRLSSSGHLLRFMTDSIKMDSNIMLVALELPKGASKDFDKTCIGISENRVHFASLDKELGLKIWVLEGQEWLVKGFFKTLHRMRDCEGDFVKPLGFHPNAGYVFVGANSSYLGSSITWVRFNGDANYDCHNDRIKSSLEIEFAHKDRSIFVKDWHGIVAFPAFLCEVSFACGFKDKSTLSST